MKPAACIVFALSVAGGCILAPGARGDLARLRKAYEAVEAQAVAITRDLRAVEDGIMQAREEKDWARLSDLLPVAKALREKVKALNAQRVEAASAIKALVKEQQVPYWQIALYVAGLVFSGGGLAHLKWVRPARGALRIVTRAIEGEPTQGEIKKRIAKADHPEIERAVKELQE